MTSAKPLFIDRPWWRRALTGGACGVAFAAFAIALELFKADIPNERAFSEFSSIGIPLWPWIRFMAIAPPLIGMMVGLIAPLFRRRHGAVIVGVLTIAGTSVLTHIAGALAGTVSWYKFVAGGLSWWQEWIVLACFLIMAVSFAREIQPHVLGEAKDC